MRATTYKCAHGVASIRYLSSEKSILDGQEHVFDSSCGKICFEEDCLHSAHELSGVCSLASDLDAIRTKLSQDMIDADFDAVFSHLNRENIEEEEERNLYFDIKSKIDRMKEASISLFRYPFKKGRNHGHGASPSRHVHNLDLVYGLSAAFLAPACSLMRDENGRKCPPVISSLLRIDILSSDDDSVSLASATTFEIKVAYGNIMEWRISKRTIDFLKLHAVLTYRYLQGHLPKIPSFPNQVTYFLDSAKWRWNKDKRARQYKELISRARRNSLEAYLRSVAASLHMHMSTEFAEFLEVSSYSLDHARKSFFVQGCTVSVASAGDASSLRIEHSSPAGSSGRRGNVPPGRPGIIFKGKEGFLNHLFLSKSLEDAGARRSVLSGMVQWTKDLYRSFRYERKWIYVAGKEGAIVILDNNTALCPCSIILCGPSTTVSFARPSLLDMASIDASGPANGDSEGDDASAVSVETRRRDGRLIWTFKPVLASSFKSWLHSFIKLKFQNADAFENEKGLNRFSSSCPVRRNQYIKWFIDAASYFEVLLELLERARFQVFLSGWWISPELYLKRPPTETAEYRLDNILRRIADRGVMIYILIFKEFAMALPINSRYTKFVFERAHPNIKVQRHPDLISGGNWYWAHHEKLVIIDQVYAFIGGIDLCYGRYDDNHHLLTDIKMHALQQGSLSMMPTSSLAPSSVWIGQDYYNPRIKDFRGVHEYRNTLIDRKIVPRMPWHDVHSLVMGPDIVSDLSRLFIQKWNFIKKEKSMHKESVPFLAPIPVSRLSSAAAIPADAHRVPSMQVIRSSSGWSSGDQTETSILNAYIEVIKNSKRFVYIENQFFISSCQEGRSNLFGPSNEIALALSTRIVRAFKNGEKYRVVILIPLLPAFESDVYMSHASSLRMILDAQLSSLSTGANSLFSTLRAASVPIEEYVSIFSLRKCGPFYTDSEDGVELSRFVTEQIYVHSKLLIADDSIAILGSANINDRSMLGTRDSEVNVVLETNGRPAPQNAIFSLRRDLLAEHLGLDAEEGPLGLSGGLDFLDDQFYSLMRERAAENTLWYRDTFHSLPDDSVHSWADYRRFVSLQPSLGSSKSGAAGAQPRGNIVLYPCCFLQDENLGISILTPEYLLPSVVFH